MQYVEVVLSANIDGGYEPWFSDGIAISFQKWSHNYQPQLLDAPIRAYIDWSGAPVPGDEICRHIRGSTYAERTHITVLLGDGDVHGRELALRSGADSYINGRPDRAKIVKSVLAVTSKQFDDAAPVVSDGMLLIDDNRRRVFLDGRHVPMWPAELNLLRHFMKNKGRVFTRGELISALGKDSRALNESTIYRTVSRLRGALRDAGAQSMIRTVRPTGYIMDE